MAFDLPPNSGAERDKAILDHIRQHDYKAVWTTLTVPAGDSQIELKIMADALMIGGIRVSVSAELQQMIADMFGCMLMTPKIADLLYLGRAKGADGNPITLTPQLQPVDGEAKVTVSLYDDNGNPIPGKTARVLMDSTIAMISESRKIDAEIKKQGGKLGGKGILQTVGKHWVVGNALLQHPGKAENYGWHFQGATFGGASWEPAVTPGLRVIQGQGWFHDMKHVDASQTCVLVHQVCKVDGKERSLQGVLSDPALAKYLNHDGVLKVMRQPGTIKLPVSDDQGGMGNPIAMITANPARTAAMVVGAGIGFAAAGPVGAIAGAAAGWAVGKLGGK